MVQSALGGSRWGLAPCRALQGQPQGGYNYLAGQIQSVGHISPIPVQKYPSLREQKGSIARKTAEVYHETSI